MANYPAKIENSVRVVACPHPFKIGRDTYILEPGLTIAEIMQKVQPDALLRQRAHVWVNSDYIVPEEWGNIIPKPGCMVAIRMVPGGAVGRIIGTIFIAIAAIAVSFLTAGALTPLLGAAWAGIAGGLAGLVVGIVGNMILNALIPPTTASNALSNLSTSASLDYGTTSNTLSITGASNKEAKYYPIPKVLGKHKMSPPYGARTYTESSGSDQYLRLLFVWGFGPVALEDLRIGQTPLANFQGVEVEHRNLTIDGVTYGDDPLTLYTVDIHEEVLSIELLKDVENVHTSEIDADELSIDVVCPSGLIGYTSSGSTYEIPCDFTITYRLTGVGDYISAGTINLDGNTKSAVRGNLRWVPAVRGQYDVKVVRTTAADTIWTTSVSYWTALRTIKNEDPIDFPYSLAKTAMRIKATGQLNGTVDEFTGVVTSIVPDWDATTSTWITRATQNPASLYRAAVQGNHTSKPLADSRMDLVKLQYWHEYCTTEGWKYNKVIDYQTTVKELLDEIAAAGRAAFAWIDSKLGVIIDEPQPFTIGPAFTPRNILKNSYQGTMTYPDLPHAFRVQFINEDLAYQQDERIVLDDGYQIDGLDAWGNAAPTLPEATIFEQLELSGITDPDLVFRHGRYHIASARLRPEVTQFGTDLEWMVATRGDRIKFGHDVMGVGLAYGRVTGLLYDSNGEIMGVTVDEKFAPFILTAPATYCARFRLADNTSLLCIIDAASFEVESQLIFGNPIALTSDYPKVGDLFLFGEFDEEAVDLIVKSIQPNNDLSATVMAVAYNEAIYEADQGTIPTFTSKLSMPEEWYQPIISSIRSDETVMLQGSDGTLQPRMLITLLIPSSLDVNITGVECEYWVTDSSEAHITLPVVPVSNGEISITGVEVGKNYSIQLRYVNTAGQRGIWTAIVTHTVSGKDAPPTDVPLFYLNQISDLVSFQWTQVSDADLSGYEIRYGSVGITWSNSILLVATAKSVNAIAAWVPPGTWDFMIKAKDTAGNYSENEYRITKTIYSGYTTVIEVSARPLWTGTLTNYVLNPLTGNLNPQDQDLADADNQDLFDTYVINPYDESVYESPEVDLEADIVVRVWANIFANLGPDEIGAVGPQLWLDYKLESGAYNGFEAWGVGIIEARYLKLKFTNDNTVGLCRITDFIVGVDSSS